MTMEMSSVDGADGGGNMAAEGQDSDEKRSAWTGRSCSRDMDRLLDSWTDMERHGETVSDNFKKVCDGDGSSEPQKM